MLKRLALALLAAVVVAGCALVAVYVFAPRTAAAWMVAGERTYAGLDERQIQVGEFRIHYLIGGSGPPLLLLHGFGADKDNWTPIAARLTPHYRVIAPDLPGFGESSHPFDADYSIAAQVARVRAFVQALGLGAVHLGGNSMGGDIAGMYTAAYPDAVRSLWLLDPGGVATAKPSAYTRALQNGNANVLIPRTEAQFNQLLDFVAVHPPFLPGALRDVLAQRAVARHDLLVRIFAQIAHQRVPLEQALADSPVPTLILWGAQDQVLDPSGAQVLADAMADAQVVLMPDTGHIPMLERPAAAASHYLEFERSAGLR